MKEKDYIIKDHNQYFLINKLAWSGFRVIQTKIQKGDMKQKEIRELIRWAKKVADAYETEGFKGHNPLA